MVVKRISRYLVDVFTGKEGWEPHEWVRLALVKGEWKYMKGNGSLTKGAVAHLTKEKKK